MRRQPIPQSVAVPRVFRASSGMLYLVGGTNGAAWLHTGQGFAARIDTAAWRNRIARRHEAARQAGARFAQLIVPEKLAVYPLGAADREAVFPGCAAEDVVPPGLRLLRGLPAGQIVYPRERLRQARQHAPVYQPTDSHWTAPGALAAFEVLMALFGLAPDPAVVARLRHLPTWYRGDLWEPCWSDMPEDNFTRFAMPPTIRRSHANPIVAVKESQGLENEPGLHLGSCCLFQNSAAQFSQTVVLFGTSFSECRLAPSLLTAILACYFATVHFIWSTAVDMDYVARTKAHFTVAEMPERFLTDCPDDDTAVEDFAAEQLRKWQTRAV